jgi:putative DNA primase/helicase
MAQDWNDLHVEQGLDVVRSQLDTAVASAAPVQLLDLPQSPSFEEPAESGAPAPEGGVGSGWTAERIFTRFALVEGKTAIFDTFKRVIIKKSAFEMLVTKPLAKEWLDLPVKKVIADDMAERLASKAKAEAKFKQVSGDGMAPVDRYVYIDGTKDTWDVQKRRRVPEGALKMSLGDAYGMWLNSPDRRTVDMEHSVFDPRMTKDPEVYINTFEGLPLVPNCDRDKCETLRWIITFLCNGDLDAADWLTKWLAFPLQHVGAKMDTAVLFHSTEEGSGKSLLFSDIMGRIYGDCGATVGQAQLESNWTVWQSNKLYGVFEEVVSRDQRYNQVGKIKHMVTGKTVRMESKFVNGWEEANHMNAVFLSNEIMPWPIGEKDRRMLVMWPKDPLPEERQKRVKHELANGGVEALYDYLLCYPLGDFDERTKPPNTAARQRLVELSMASWQTFLREWRYGMLGAPFDVCVSSDLYALFLEWCHRNKEHTLSHTKFSGFVSTQVDKVPRVPWMEGARRSFGTFFFPWSGVERAPSPPPSLSAAALGKAVAIWREQAKASGWSVDSWEHVKFADRGSVAA